MIEKLHISQTW